MRAVVSCFVLPFSCGVFSAVGAGTETRLGTAVPLVQVKPLRPDYHQFDLTLLAEVAKHELRHLTKQLRC